jgi:Zn-dependent protease
VDRSASTSPSDAGFSASIPLFRISGIRIQLHVSWFLIFALLLWSLAAGYLPNAYPGRSPVTYWLAGAVATLMFFVSILLHELAHSLVALRHGIDIPSITLFVFGGVSRLGKEVTRPDVELKVAIAGPLASFALAFVFAVLRMVTSPAGGEAAGLLAVVFGYLALVNGLLGFFNLLPGFPLDGGRVLRAVLWWWTGSFERATRAAAESGKLVGLFLIVLGALQIFFHMLVGGFWFILIGLFLRGMASANYESVLLRRALGNVRVGEVMLREVVTVPSDLTLKRLTEDFILGLGYRGFPVVDDGEVRGLISVNEVARVPRERWDELRVKDAMVPVSPGLCVAPSEPLVDALVRVTQAGGRSLVLEEGRLVGMLTKDALTRFVELRKLAVGPESSSNDAARDGS